MNTKQQISALRTAALALAAAAMLAACSDEEFVRDAGQLPAEAGSTPTGALYARGSFDPQLQDFTISENTTVEVVYRLSFPAPTDVTVTLSLGDQYDIDAYNDAEGLKDDLNFRPNVLAPYQRYRMLPESNFTLPETLTLTVEKGRTESAPLTVEVVYDEVLLPSDFAKRMLWPWMLPLRVEKVEGEVVPAADQMLGIGIRPANEYDPNMMSDLTYGPIEEYLPKEEDFTFITYCDCREFDPSCAIYYYYGKANFQMGEFWLDYLPETVRHSPLFDVEILHPAFIASDPTGMPVVEPSTDLMYVLTHQERYVDPQREFWMKICVSLETERKSPVGLCNLSEEACRSLVWQIAEMVKTYRLDGVALNDKPADYAAAGAPAVDRGSYTRFLKALREALGPDKLIMVSYDADQNAALYEAHDGVQAGDYIDYAWWGTENEFCTPYDPAAPTCRPIAGLPVNQFSPMAANAVETEAFQELFTTAMKPTGGQYSQSALPKLKELNDKGQCSVLVYLTLRANLQNFYEYHFAAIPQIYGQIPCHEGDGMEIPGWFSIGGFSQDAMKNLPHFSGYGSGLKDW